MVNIVQSFPFRGSFPKPEKAPKKEPKPLKRTPIKRTKLKQKPRKVTGEKVLFDMIWATRPHVCQVTGDPILEFDVRCFMHILSKGAFPAFRLLAENIYLVLPEVHHEYDCGGRNDPMFDEVNKLHDELVERYYKAVPGSDK